MMFSSLKSGNGGQYNTPIEVYNDAVIEEMVKTIDCVPPRVNDDVR
jgi:hypothetical protein